MGKGSKRAMRPGERSAGAEQRSGYAGPSAGERRAAGIEVGVSQQEERQRMASIGSKYFYQGQYHTTPPTQTQLDVMYKAGEQLVITGASQGEIQDWARSVKGAPTSTLEVTKEGVTRTIPRQEFEQLQSQAIIKAQEKWQQQKVQAPEVLARIQKQELAKRQQQELIRQQPQESKFFGFKIPSYEQTAYYRETTKRGKTPLSPLIERSKTLQRFYGYTEPKTVEYGKGYYEQWREHPYIQTGLFALPSGLSRFGAGVKWLGAATKISKIPGVPQIASATGKTAGLILGGAYIKGTVEAYKKAPSKGGFLGAESAKLSALILGGAAAPKLEGYIGTLTRRGVPAETIIAPEILSGQKRFPTAPPSKHYELFLKSKYKLPKETKLGVWHGTPSKFAYTTKVPRGTSELPGLYTAPSLSAYFLKIQKQSYKFFDFGFPVGTKPAALRIYPSGIRRGLPKELGYAYVPGIKTEIEAVIPMKTELTRLPSKYYTTIWKTRVPIDIYGVSGKGKAGAISYNKLIEKYSSYYGKRPSLLDPFSLAASRLVSRRKPSYQKPSYAISVIRPSYKPIKYPTPVYPTLKYPTKYKPSRYPTEIYPTIKYLTPKYPTSIYPTPKYRPPKYPPTKYPPYKPKIPKTPPPGLLFKPKRGIGRFRPSKREIKAFGYVPSFTALYFGKTGKVSPKKLKGKHIFTGLELREIPSFSFRRQSRRRRR